MADQPFDLFYLPFRPALDANGIVVPGASLTFYLSGTSTLRAIYADAALTVPLDNPVTANGAGVWPAIYIDNSVTYRVVLRNGFGAVLNEVDPYVPGSVGGAIGQTGPANNTYTDLPTFKASDITQASAIYDGSIWTWTPGDYTGRADDALVVQSNSVAITSGAWVRQDLTAGIPAEFFGISPTNTAAVNTPLFHKMWDFAAGRLTRIGNARYPYAGSYAGAVNMSGERMPGINPARTALENGSILVGSCSFSGTSIALQNLGVDNYATGGDAIKLSAATYNAGRVAHLANVVGLGRSAADPSHSILVEGYEQFSMTNVVGANNQYAIAIKSRNGTLAGWRSINAATGLILKSDGSGAGTGSMSKVVVTGGNVEGSAGSVYAVRVLADNQPIAGIVVAGVNMADVDYGLVVEAGAGMNITESSFSGFTGKNVRLFGLQTGGAGAIRKVNFSDFDFADLGDYAGQIQNGSSITVRDFYGSMKAGSTAHAATFFRVESTVTGFTGDNIELVENYGAGATTPSLYLQCQGAYTRLTNIRANIEGILPTYGFASQMLDGATNTINPRVDLDRGRSFVKLTASADVSITSINSFIAGTTRLPEGYLITLVPVAAYNFTFVNNATLRNRVADVLITVNQSLTYVHIGAGVFVQVDNEA